MSFYPDFVPYNASANVRPARILAIGTVEAQAAEATGVTAPMLGISANRFKLGAPNSFESQAVPFIAVTGDSITYFAKGQVADCLCGAAITSLVLPVTSDGSGRAVTASISGAGVAFFVGWPLNTTANANEIVRVRIDPDFSSK